MENAKIIQEINDKIELTLNDIKYYISNDMHDMALASIESAKNYLSVFNLKAVEINNQLENEVKS